MEEGLSFRELEPFGVEIEADLSIPLPSAAVEAFRALFRRHGLLIARGQSLSRERQRALCAHLGPILEREGESGVLSNEPGGPAASAYAWHADAAYTDAPFDALSLHAIELVDGASSTRFASAERAFVLLSEALRAELGSRSQTMISPHFERLDQRTCDDPDPPFMKRGVRPTTIENPHNGRTCVWVSEMQTARLDGLPWEEGRICLHAVFDVLYAPGNVYEHVWRAGDLVIWDNIALQHARASQADVGPRRLQRVIVGREGAAPHVET